MEHYDGEFYTLRLFSPIEGEIYSLNSTEEGIHLTAYEMENYSSFIRDHMEGVGLFPDDRTLCKFKAALELEQCDSLEQALRIAENLDCYSYDPQMYSMASYARYLFRELEFNIDDPAFATFDFQGYGERQLGLLESVQTTYGMITRNEDFPIQTQQNTEQGMKMQ